MLILSRKLNESIVIDGRIIVKVLRIEKDTVKLGIQAPPELPVHRQEVYEAILRSQQAGGTGPGPGGRPAGGQPPPAGGSEPPSSGSAPSSPTSSPPTKK
jgi:carbon storage regulator